MQTKTNTNQIQPRNHVLIDGTHYFVLTVSNETVLMENMEHPGYYLHTYKNLLQNIVILENEYASDDFLQDRLKERKAFVEGL